MLHAIFHGVQDHLIDQVLDGRAIGGKVVNPKILRFLRSFADS
jgi:hypothetical protein